MAKPSTRESSDNSKRRVNIRIENLTDRLPPTRSSTGNFLEGGRDQGFIRCYRAWRLKSQRVRFLIRIKEGQKPSVTKQRNPLCQISLFWWSIRNIRGSPPRREKISDILHILQSFISVHGQLEESLLEIPVWPCGYIHGQRPFRLSFATRADRLDLIVSNRVPCESCGASLESN